MVVMGLRRPRDTGTGRARSGRRAAKVREGEVYSRCCRIMRKDAEAKRRGECKVSRKLKEWQQEAVEQR